MLALSLLVLFSLQMVVLAAFNSPCTTDADCDIAQGELCERLEPGYMKFYYRCLTYPLTNEQVQTLNAALLERESYKIGSRRKCSVSEPDTCFGSNHMEGVVSSPRQCCSQQAYLIRSRFTCTNGASCDASSGCSAHIDCRGKEMCIDTKCKTPQEGVECGRDGQKPVNKICCGGGIDKDGLCYWRDYTGDRTQKGDPSKYHNMG